MLKLFQNSSISNELKQQLPIVYSLSVRWATKPRWVPIAKSKQFRVPPRRRYNPETSPEIARLTNNYRTLMKAIFSEIRESYAESSTAEEVIEKREKDIKDAWEECMRINDEWNQKVALEREERNRLEFEASVEAAKLKMQRVDAKIAKNQKNIDKLIREQMELSKTFITEKNIDAHIEKILNDEPHTFCWAMDIKGKIYEGYNKYPSSHKSLVDTSAKQKSEEEPSQAQAGSSS